MNIINRILGNWGFRIVKNNNFIWNCWPIQKEKHVVFFEEDADFHFAYNDAQIATQMQLSDNPLRRQRHYTLVQLFKNSIQLNGDVVECGTFQGLSAFQIGRIIKENTIDKSFHIFDSFEGLSVHNEEGDIGQTEELNEKLRKQFSYGEGLVRQNLNDYNFINYYKGWIPDRFNEVEDKKFCFVHIDVDLFQPIKDSIEFFYPKLVDRGIMVFDDYGYTAQFPGAKKAVDEAIMKLKPSFFLSLPSGQSYLIK